MKVHHQSSELLWTVCMTFFLGLVISAHLTEAATDIIEPGAAVAREGGEISENEIGGLAQPSRPEEFYYAKGVSPIKKMMSRFIVHKRIPIHKRGIPIHKRIPYMVHKRMDGFGSMDGFHGDTFSSGFGDFSTAKRGKRLMTGSGFYGGDTFSQGFGDFSTAKRSGTYDFHGDTFSDGFGDFMTV